MQKKFLPPFIDSPQVPNFLLLKIKISVQDEKIKTVKFLLIIFLNLLLRDFRGRGGFAFSRVTNWVHLVVGDEIEISSNLLFFINNDCMKSKFHQIFEKWKKWSKLLSFLEFNLLIEISLIQIFTKYTNLTYIVNEIGTLWHSEYIIDTHTYTHIIKFIK